MSHPRRAFLVLADQPLLESIVAGASQPHRIPTLARELARRALPHQRAAAVSERVIGDVRKRPQARDNQRFGFAAGNLPYLLAAQDPDALASGIRAIAGMESESELEALFTAEGEKLGVHARSLDRATYAAPHEEALAAHFAAELQLLARATRRAGLLSRLFRPPEFAPEALEIAGRILGRVGPAFAEGRDRSLAVLASTQPPTPAYDTELTEPLELPGEAVRLHFGPVDPASPIAASLRALAARAFGNERAHVAAPAALDQLLGDRWPELQGHARRWFLSDELEDWRLVVRTAARVASDRDTGLIESDRVFRWGYRWPPL